MMGRRVINIGKSVNGEGVEGKISEENLLHT